MKSILYCPVSYFIKQLPAADCAVTGENICFVVNLTVFKHVLCSPGTVKEPKNDSFLIACFV